MSEHSSQQLTGSERLQRRITLADLLTGAAIALWLIPIAFLFVDVPNDVLALVVALASTLGLSTFMLGLVLRAQRRNTQWRQKAGDTSVRRHNELVAQVAANHEALTELVRSNNRILLTSLAEVRQQLAAVAGKLDRASWDIYADAITDVQGGPDVVNGEDTRQLPPRPYSNVVRLPHATRGGF